MEFPASVSVPFASRAGTTAPEEDKSDHPEDQGVGVGMIFAEQIPERMNRFVRPSPEKIGKRDKVCARN